MLNIYSSSIGRVPNGWSCTIVYHRVPSCHHQIVVYHRVPSCHHQLTTSLNDPWHYIDIHCYPDPTMSSPPSPQHLITNTNKQTDRHTIRNLARLHQITRQVYGTILNFSFLQNKCAISYLAQNHIQFLLIL